VATTKPAPNKLQNKLQKKLQKKPEPSLLSISAPTFRDITFGPIASRHNVVGALFERGNASSHSGQTEITCVVSDRQRSQIHQALV
jgi:hypothetical protein